MENLNPLRGAIRAFVLSRVKDPAIADDVTQETLLRLTQRLHTLRDAERLEAWVFQIARNVVADHFRAAKESAPFDEEMHTSKLERETHEPLATEDERLRRAVAAYVTSLVEELPEPYRGALQLTEFEGVSQVELAARIGLSVSAAKSRVQRARGMLREEMERCCRGKPMATAPFSMCNRSRLIVASALAPTLEKSLRLFLIFSVSLSEGRRSAANL
jgi:RNA polymerase sigma-70 factor (ECF subfamily)